MNPFHFDQCDDNFSCSREEYLIVSNSFLVNQLLTPRYLDPGINTPAESLFELDDDLVGLATGLEFLDGADIDLYRNLVPTSLAQGVESCLEKCGIPKTDYV